MSRDRSRPSRPALLLLLVYAPLAWTWSPIFPFCSVPMYADLAGYRESHVPVFLADGERADPAEFEAFDGLDPDTIVLPRPASLDFVTERHAWWVRTHLWDGSGEVPGVEVAVGWARYVATPEGVTQGPVEIVAHGRARRR